MVRLHRPPMLSKDEKRNRNRQERIDQCQIREKNNGHDDRARQIAHDIQDRAFNVDRFDFPRVRY